MFTYLNARLVNCQHHKTSVLNFRISAVMSKKRNAGSFRHMFSSFVYGVLVMPDDKYGS